MDAKAFLSERVPLFAGVGDGHLTALAAASALATYRSGQSVLFQGETVDGLRVLCAGKAAVLLRRPGKGQERVAELSPGDVFGETSIVERGTSGAAVRAEEDGTAVLAIPQEAFRDILREDAAFAARVEALIASRRRPAPAKA